MAWLQWTVGIKWLTFQKCPLIIRQSAYRPPKNVRGKILEHGTAVCDGTKHRSDNTNNADNIETLLTLTISPVHRCDRYLPLCAGEFSVALTTPDDVTNFTRGDNVTLRCVVGGDVTDDIQVTWSRDGDVIIEGERSVVNGGRLTLYCVTPDDSGQYTCEAVRRQQQADASLTITVHGSKHYRLYLLRH